VKSLTNFLVEAFVTNRNLFDKYVNVDLLAELARREKEAGIFPEAELDLFMKVLISYYVSKTKQPRRTITGLLIYYIVLTF